MNFENDEDFFDNDDYDRNEWERMSREELEEEIWDAMTDGQYGDYPGGYVDYDVFGF